jgi:hypothetical protein
LAAGDIDVGHAMNVSFWASMSFGSTPATSIDIKPVFVPEPRGTSNIPTASNLHAGDNMFTADLESTSASNWFVVTSAAVTFASWMVGKWLHINSGTNFTPGTYLITAYDSVTDSLTLATQCGSGGNATVGFAAIPVEYQECAIATSGGTSTLTPHIYQFTSAIVTSSGADAKDGGHVAWTVPVPACRIMRVYARANGNAALTSLQLGVTLMPEGGV